MPCYGYKYKLLINHYLICLLIAIVSCVCVCRLRDELNVLDTSSPSSGNMSSRPHDRSSTSVEEEGASSASYLGTTVSDSYDTNIS